MRRILLALAIVAVAVSASAQTVAGGRFRLNTGPCTTRSGAGTPEGAVAGKVCDVYVRTDGGAGTIIYVKESGAGTNTGWIAAATVSSTAPIGATYITQTANATLTAEQALSALATGYLKVTTGTGVVTSQAVPIPVADGGTGLTTLTAHALYVGNTTTAPTALAVGATGAYLRGASGADPLWSTLILPNSATTGDLLYASGTNAIGNLAAVATGQVLVSAGASTAPAWSATPSLTSIGGATTLTLNPTGDLVTDPAGNDILPVTNYDITIGALATKYLALHAAELWVETLVAQNTIATIGGRVLVAPTNILTVDLAAGGTTLTVKYNNFSNGDRIYLEAAGKVEWMSVDSAAGGGAGAYTYTVTRNLDGSGANQWYAGDAALDTGTTGGGFIDLYSVAGVLSGAGPTIVGNVRTGTTYNNIEPRWAIGNLNGLYGYGATTYGAAFGSPSAAWVKIDPTNGVRIGHNATTYAQIDASGNASFTGAVTANTGYIGGASGWVISAGYLKDVAGVVGLSSVVTGGDDVRFWAGDATPGSAEFRVTEAGALTATSGAIGGFTLAANTLSSGTDADYVAMSSAGTNAFWAGDSTFADAEFSVTAAGVLKASNATITAASGTISLDSNGVTMTLPSSYSDTNAYRWAASGSIAGSTFGVYAQQQAIPAYRYVKLANVSSSDAFIQTLLHAENSSTAGTIEITANPVASGGVAHITLNPGTGGDTTVYGDFGVTGTQGLTGIGRDPQSGYSLLVQGPGTTSATYSIYANNSTPTTTFYVRDDGAGYLLAAAWTYGSDRRLKDHVRYFDDGLDTIMALRPARFNYRGDGPKNQVGFVAQDVQVVIPEAVSAIDNGMLGLKSEFITPFLVNAVQELERRLSALEAKSKR